MNREASTTIVKLQTWNEFFWRSVRLSDISANSCNLVPPFLDFDPFTTRGGHLSLEFFITSENDAVSKYDPSCQSKG